MTWIRVSACLLAVSLLLAPSLAAVCPDSCICSTTRDGLHRATCSKLAALYKFTLQQKHHNINILDLSHNNITKITHELDRLTEVVTLDLSTNGLSELNKFLNNAKKLVHLNLANNRIRTLSLTHLPTSVSSLDLTNNLLRNVPSDLGHLSSLEHFELLGNPLDCSCENIIARDHLLANKVLIDAVTCVSPTKLKGQAWTEIKTRDVCKIQKAEPNFLDMMMGDQPVDAELVAKETTALKSMPLVAKNDLEDGNVIRGEEFVENDDHLAYLPVHQRAPSEDIEGSGEGSGDIEHSTVTESILDYTYVKTLNAQRLASDEIDADMVSTTEIPIEGSGIGEGSGWGLLEDDEVTTAKPDMSTPVLIDLGPSPVTRLFDTGNDSDDSVIPTHKPPSVFEGDPNWYKKTEPATVENKATTPLIARDTTISEKIQVTQASEVLGQVPGEEKTTPHKTGTYVCIAIIVVLLVGLIGFAIMKGQMRKRRDRRLLRQQKRDVEKASKEMVDMNKSLLGKPAPIDTPVVNGKYELVPTHEPPMKKGENGDLGNGIKHSDTNGTGARTDSPRDTNQNRSSSKDNNLVDDTKQETSFDSDPNSPDSRKDTHSLSSEDIFVPINDDVSPRLNGTRDSDVSQPLINGDQMTDSDFLSPSREYVPVYSPDMGRVRIKMAEIPKPKTPVLVTRSRSNAGDIIITPTLDSNVQKSTT